MYLGRMCIFLDELNKTCTAVFYRCQDIMSLCQYIPKNLGAVVDLFMPEVFMASTSFPYQSGHPEKECLGIWRPNQKQQLYSPILSVYNVILTAILTCLYWFVLVTLLTSYYLISVYGFDNVINQLFFNQLLLFGGVTWLGGLNDGS